MGSLEEIDEAPQSGETQFSKEFVDRYISSLKIESTDGLESSDIQIIDVLNQAMLKLLDGYSNLDDPSKFVCLQKISIISRAKAEIIEGLRKNPIAYHCPHLNDIFKQEYERVATQCEVSLDDVEEPVNERRHSRRSFFYLATVLAAGLIGASVQKKFDMFRAVAGWFGFNETSGVEQKILDSNKLSSTEKARITDILQSNLENIRNLYEFYKEDIVWAYDQAVERLQAKRGALHSMINSSDEIFSEIIAAKLWNHDKNTVLSEEDLAGSFNGKDVFYVPESEEDTRYGTLYNPEYLVQYYKDNFAGKFGEPESLDFKQTLLVSLMYLSDNERERIPLAASVQFCVDFVHRMLFPR